jgi:predicted nucleic acid-binding protein
LFTTDYVIDETLTLLRTRLDMRAAQRWWQMVSRSPRLHTEWIGPQRAEQARQWFFKWQDHPFSFTDCTSFTVMQELAMEHVLTSDRHFRIAGFQILPA